MQRDRFLMAILAGIGALVLVSLALFFFRQGKVAYQDDSMPAGVVNNYLLALQRHDYSRAYSYMVDVPNKPSLIQFQEPFLQYQSSELSNTPVEIGSVIIDEASQSAIVQLTLVRGGQGFLEDPYRDFQTAQLVKQNGAWKIASFPYPYWSYNWSFTVTPTVTPVQPKPAP
jgi:hypothetical protein